MLAKILVSSDGSEAAERALWAGIGLAQALETELHMVCVERLPSLPVSINDAVAETALANQAFEAVTAEATAQAKAEGVPLTTHVVSGQADEAIIEFAGREGFDLLIISADQHSSLQDRLIGSATSRLIEHAPCAVLVVK